jgi:hypothetical protein
MLALPSLYQRDKHIKAISLRRIALCGDQALDFLENAAVVTLGFDRCNIHGAFHMSGSKNGQLLEPQEEATSS